MINFYIELQNRNNFRFRLQKDLKTWRKITDSRRLTKDDLLTSDVVELIKIQEIDSSIDLDEVTFQLNRTSSLLADSSERLSYYIYVERNYFPLIPSIEQLVSTIKHGDDRISNTLILNCFGFFELRARETVNIMIEDPTIIVRNETFYSGNGYVGLEASKDENLIRNLYNDLLSFWIEHLKFGCTNEYSDTTIIQDTTILIAEINELKKSFKFNPEY